MNDVSVFQFNQAHDVRVVVRDGEPWFCAADVFRVLGIVNGRNLLKTGDYSDGVHQMYTIDSLGRKQKTNFINEPNLYRIIFRSDKKEAKQFQDWVFNQVLPEIRKTGQFVGEMPKVITITHAERMQLKRAVDELDNWLFNSEQLSQGAYNHIRVTYGLHNIADLPRDKLPEVMNMLKSYRQRMNDVLGVFMDLRSTVLKEYVFSGAPWTPDLKRRWTRQMQMKLPENPNWLEINRQLN